MSKSTLGFPDGSDGKESACNIGNPGLISGSGRFPGRREWQPTTVFLPEEVHGQRSLEGYSPWSCKELDTSEQLTPHYISTSRSHLDTALGNLRNVEEDTRGLSFNLWFPNSFTPLEYTERSTESHFQYQYWVCRFKISIFLSYLTQPPYSKVVFSECKLGYVTFLLYIPQWVSNAHTKNTQSICCGLTSRAKLLPYFHVLLPESHSSVVSSLFPCSTICSSFFSCTINISFLQPVILLSLPKHCPVFLLPFNSRLPWWLRW